MNVIELLKAAGFTVTGNVIEKGNSRYETRFGIVDFWEIADAVWKDDEKVTGHFLIEVDPVIGKIANCIRIDELKRSRVMRQYVNDTECWFFGFVSFFCYTLSFCFLISLNEVTAFCIYSLLGLYGGHRVFLRVREIKKELSLVK